MFPLIIALMLSGPIEPSPQDYMVAWQMLAESAEVRIPYCEDTEIIRAAIRKIALQEEILDERELKYVLARHEDFADNLDMLRGRYSDLKNAPKIAESNRFFVGGSRQDIIECLSFNRAYRNYLSNQLNLYPDRALQIAEATKEASALYRVYDYLGDSKCEYYYVTVKRKALLALKEELTQDEWFYGRLPPFVPLWRFQEE